MRRTEMRKILQTLMIAAALCAGVIMIPAGPAFAEDAGGTQSIQPSQGYSDQVFAFRKGAARDALLAQEAAYPEAFDLRNVDGKSYVTPVRLQNPFGTCWGFAAIAASESSLIASGLADETVDLSEKHLAYFTTTALDDPDSPHNGEGFIWPNVTREEEKTSAYKYNTGGDSFFATSMFASGIGPILEDKIDPDTGQSMQDILGYHGRRGEKVTRRLAIHHDEEGNPTEYARVPVWYSDDDDWAIPEKYRFYQSFRLKNSIDLPPIYGSRQVAGSYHYSQEGMLAIKQQMYENHRAVAINFCAESYVPGQDTTGKEYMSSHWAHYTNQLEFSNHAVTIVGWDDNYPKENFLTPPEGDGAFLVKNSWGSELNDFPNNGFRHWGLLEGQDGVPYDAGAKAVSDRATGYFWLSYYDKSMQNPTTFEYDRATGENGYYVEQMDYMQGLYAGMAMGASDFRMANVFTAEATSRLSELSILTTTPGTQVNYEVRLVPDDFKDPEEGLLIAEGNQTFEYGGYHRITLDPSQQKVLTRGQKYSVLAEETTEGQNYICFTVGSSDPGHTLVSKAVINPKESFCFRDGAWLDLSDRKVQESLGEFYDENEIMDNFPIKSYLETVTYQEGESQKVFDGYLTVDNWQDGTPGQFTLSIGEDKILAAEFRGLSQDMPADWDPEISWISHDPEVVSVATSGGNFGQAVITGQKEGSAYITVDAGQYGTRLLRVNVQKLELWWIDGLKTGNTYKYTGRPIQPEITAVLGDTNDTHPDTELKEGVDYVLSYKDNVNVGKGKVIATGIGDYAGTVQKSFTIKGPAVALKVKGKTVKVKAGALKKKSLTIKAKKAYAVKKAGGKLTYEKDAVSDPGAAKMFTVSRSSGAIKVGKGLEKGTYKLTVRVTAAGHGKVSGRTKYVTVTIKVK